MEGPAGPTVGRTSPLTAPPMSEPLTRPPPMGQGAIAPRWFLRPVGRAERGYRVEDGGALRVGGVCEERGRSKGVDQAQLTRWRRDERGVGRRGWR
jgi:hypothetical protein